MTQLIKLEIEQRRAYGRNLYYPVCKIAKNLCALMNKKTFTEADLTMLREGEVFAVEITANSSL